MGPTTHATAVARWGQQGWRAILLVGPSGAGKSDLALRLLGRGWRLVGDDQVHLFASGGGLHVAPARPIAGWLEVRGLGPTAFPGLVSARVALRIELGGPVERLAEPRSWTHDGVAVPAVSLDPLEASAPVKVEQALAAVLTRRPVALGPGPALA